jgi:rhodanese-related sulfurtransferase
MLKKGFKALLAEANATIDTVSVHDALSMVDDPDTVFIDVREGQERAQGHIPRSVHAPRGFLEFIADPEGPMHDPAIAVDKQLVLYCGTGGRSALAAKTLQTMGFPKVRSLAGGLSAWTQAGGQVTR